MAGIGTFYRQEADPLNPGGFNSRTVCEDCWQPIPPYVDFPTGLVSPESEGCHRHPAKTRAALISGLGVSNMPGTEHVAKVVCLPCYLKAFRRVYPHAPKPVLRADVRPNIPTADQIAALAQATATPAKGLQR